MWPFSWLSVPIFLCLAYAVFRLTLELTVNRKQHSPTIATCFVARQKIAKLLYKETSQSNQRPYTIVDLGSGRGELARCIAKKIPESRVTGIEMAYFPYMQASFIQRVLGPKNLTFERRDFWNFDCSAINAVVLYLGPITAQKMGEKLYRELKRDSMVISYTYPLLGDWKPLDVQNFYSPFREVFYVYKR